MPALVRDGRADRLGCDAPMPAPMPNAAFSDALPSRSIDDSMLAAVPSLPTYKEGCAAPPLLPVLLVLAWPDDGEFCWWCIRYCCCEAGNDTVALRAAVARRCCCEVREYGGSGASWRNAAAIPPLVPPPPWALGTCSGTLGAE